MSAKLYNIRRADDGRRRDRVDYTARGGGRPSPRYWIDKSIDHARFSIPDVRPRCGPGRRQLARSCHCVCKRRPPGRRLNRFRSALWGAETLLSKLMCCSEFCTRLCPAMPPLLAISLFHTLFLSLLWNLYHTKRQSSKLVMDISTCRVRSQCEIALQINLYSKSGKKADVVCTPAFNTYTGWAKNIAV